MTSPLNIALIGQSFMGRAHSNAWSQVGRFFDLPRQPVLHTVAGRDAGRLEGFAEQWGWQGTTTSWRDLMDIDTPTPRVPGAFLQ